MMKILYEDKEIIVVVKPSNIPMQKDFSRTKDMCTILSEYRSEKKEDKYIGMVHRLDRHVSGILVFAKTKQALKILNQQLQQKKIKKVYYACVWNQNISLEPKKVKLCHYIKKQKNVAIVEDGKSNETKEAILFYEEIGKQKEISLLKVWLETGRFHQIRAQLAHVGLPIIGDPKYGMPEIYGEKIPKIGLQSVELTFIHPTTGEKMQFSHIHEEEPFDKVSEIVQINNTDK